MNLLDIEKLVKLQLFKAMDYSKSPAVWKSLTTVQVKNFAGDWDNLQKKVCCAIVFEIFYNSGASDTMVKNIAIQMVDNALRSYKSSLMGRTGSNEFKYKGFTYLPAVPDALIKKGETLRAEHQFMMMIASNAIASVHYVSEWRISPLDMAQHLHLEDSGYWPIERLPRLRVGAKTIEELVKMNYGSIAFNFETLKDKWGFGQKGAMISLTSQRKEVSAITGPPSATKGGHSFVMGANEAKGRQKIHEVKDAKHHAVRQAPSAPPSVDFLALEGSSSSDTPSMRIRSFFADLMQKKP